MSIRSVTLRTLVGGPAGGQPLPLGTTEQDRAVSVFTGTHRLRERVYVRSVFSYLAPGPRPDGQISAVCVTAYVYEAVPESDRALMIVGRLVDVAVERGA